MGRKGRRTRGGIGYIGRAGWGCHTTTQAHALGSKGLKEGGGGSAIKRSVERRGRQRRGSPMKRMDKRKSSGKEG